MEAQIWAAIITAVSGIIIAIIARRSEKQKEEPGVEVKPAFKRELNLDKVVGKISKPFPNSLVSQNIECTGTVEGLTPEMFLWLAVEVDGLLWPKSGNLLINGTNWSQSIQEGGTSPVFSVVLLVANKEGLAFISDWLLECQRTKDYYGLNVIPGTRNLDSVRGLRQ